MKIKGKKRTCKGAARAMGILAGYVGRLVDRHLPSIIKDVYDGGPIGVFFRDPTVPRKGQVPAFDQNIAWSETLDNLGNVDNVGQGIDFGRFYAGVLEQ